MARLPRLVLPGQAHLIIQRGHNGQQVFADDPDRTAFLGALAQAAATQPVQVHGWALLDSELRMMVTPATAAALSLFMQSLGRSYVSAYNRRHGRSGTLWDGRFRCAVVEAGETLLDALRWIDGQTDASTWTSATHRLGGRRDALLVDPPEYWQLGNTPFDREAAYGRLLDQGLSQVTTEQLRAAAWGGWALGSERFADELARSTPRPLRPRPRGRPRRLVP